MSIFDVKILTATAMFSWYGQNLFIAAPDLGPGAAGRMRGANEYL